jgi:hypothetical protein
MLDFIKGVSMKSKMEDIPPKILNYLMAICTFYNQPTSFAPFLYWIATESIPYNGNLRISLNKHEKAKIALLWGVSVKRLTQALTGFSHISLEIPGQNPLRKVVNGIYILNSNLFGRTVWDCETKIVKLVLKEEQVMKTAILYFE